MAVVSVGDEEGVAELAERHGANGRRVYVEGARRVSEDFAGRDQLDPGVAHIERVGRQQRLERAHDEGDARETDQEPQAPIRHRRILWQFHGEERSAWSA